MADDRTFTLIGNFVDNITGPIEKINASIAGLKNNLSGFHGKKGSFSDLTQSMGKVINAHMKLKEEIAGVRNELKDTLPVLREYRREVGKTVSANMWLQGRGKGQTFVKKNNPTLQFLQAATDQANELKKATNGVTLGRRVPRAAGGGGGGGGGGGNGPRPPRTPSYPTGGGGYVPSARSSSSSTFGTKKFGVSRDETFAFGQTLGYTLGTTVTGAIVQGFQIGVGLMVKPFQMFAGALQERVQDELSDISAAGGLLSVAKRQKENPIVRSFQDSMDLTQQTNKYMAQIAAALPGDTQQYIEVGKRMSDTAARMIAADPAKAIKYAQELAAKEGAGRVVNTQKEAYTQIIGNMATQGVLAGLGEGGGGAGARGVMGAYGLPQLMERMMNDQEVTMGQFQRYAAIFRDPKIMDALERFIPKINATMKGTVDRARVFDKFFEEVLPPEMIRAFERSSAGIMEAFRTAFIGPETGLLGLGRKFENMGKKMDAYGRYLDKKGNITDFKNAADTALSLFDMLRDIFANISIALYPLVEILPQIFDPLKNIGDLLVDARHISGQFLQSFEYYLNGMEDLMKTTKKGNADFAKTHRARAGLLAITNFLTDVGAFSEMQFEAMRLDILNKPSAELGDILNNILKTFFESKVAYDIGNLIGSVVGTVLKQVATMVEYFLGIAKTSQLASGLKDGFYKSGGPEAFRSIIQNVFRALFKALIEIFKVAPLEISIIGSIALLIPAFVASISIMLANWLEGVLDKFNSTCGRQLGKAKNLFSGGACAMPGGGLGGVGADLKPNARTRGASSVAMRPVGPKAPPGFEHIALPGVAPSLYGVTQPGQAPSVPKPVTPLKKTPFGALSKLKGRGVGVIASAMITLETATPGLVKAGKALKTFAKGMPGVGVALAGLDFAFRKIMGEDTAKAAGGAIGAGVGGTLGGVAGSALGPAGAFVGATLGAWLGDWIGQNIGPVLAQLPSKLSGMWEGVVTFFNNWPYKLGAALATLQVSLENGFVNLYNWFSGMSTRFGEWLNKVIVDLRLKWNNFMKQVAVDFQSGAIWSKLGNALVNGLKMAIQMAVAVLNPGVLAQMLVNKGKNMAGDILGGIGQGYQAQMVRERIANPTPDAAQGTALSPIFARAQAKGALGDAIASEMRNKPPGSNLVIANSSETVIPAAGGYGMKQFIGTISEGFAGVKRAFDIVGAGVQQADQNSQTRDQQTNTKLTDYHNQTQAQILKLSQNLSSLSTQVSTMGSMGGMGGGLFGAGMGGSGVGQVIAVGKMLQGMGLNVAENPAFGSGRVGQHAPGSYHYSGRAIDVTGSDAQLDAAYSKLKAMGGYAELLWRTAGHYDHLHVAYALGAGMPAFFGSQQAAMQWERSMVPGSVRVGSVTGNSAEGFGSGTNVVNNITINQQPGQDADELASIVALKIGEAVSDARASSLFV